MNENTISYQVDNAPGNAFVVSLNNVTLISDTMVRSYLKAKYGAFICVDLVAKFQVFTSLHVADYSKASAAWVSNYNPLDNYNGEETHIILDSHGTKTNTRATDSEHNTVKNEILTGSKTDNYATTYDDTTPRLESRSESQGGSQSVDDLTINNTETFDNTTLSINGISYSAHDVHGETITKKGNLGITTSQQMIQSEIDLRFYPIQKQYIDRFVYENAYFASGAWGCYY